jgi:dolichyl-phosphate beta-glucosyltransferase
MDIKESFLSVIVPVFNESGRVHNASIISDYLNQQEFSSELIIVDDGSTDNTVNILENTSSNPGRRIISYEPNRGKGYAIKVGMVAAQGKYRLFTDIDLSTPMEEFDKFLPHLEGYDVIIGSRRIEGARVLRHQSTVRESLGRGFTYLSNLILQLAASDFTCGFKCFSRSAAEKIFPKLTIDRWGFDSEVLYIAKKQVLSVKEIPVIWANDPHTKVRFPHDLIRSFTDLIRIRFNNFRKIYD